jgi:hypothetical protein
MEAAWTLKRWHYCRYTTRHQNPEDLDFNSYEDMITLAPHVSKRAAVTNYGPVFLGSVTEISYMRIVSSISSFTS